MIATLIFAALFQAATGDPAAVIAPAPASAPVDADSSRNQPQQAISNENGRITHYTCRQVEIIGTRLSRRVCQTQANVDSDDREAHDALQRLQSIPDMQSH